MVEFDFSFYIFGITGLIIFVIGLYGIINKAAFISRIICFNISSAGTFLFLISTARRNAIILVSSDGSTLPVPDPVPHAMVLTGLVVAVAMSAFALALTRKLYLLQRPSSFPEESYDIE
jgi:multicomponent Na+:H+ antiporter subunit C